MTKREARKIATLRTAAMLNEDDTIDCSWPKEGCGKIETEQKRLAKSLAKRYGYEVSDVPVDTLEIITAVLSGDL